MLTIGDTVKFKYKGGKTVSLPREKGKAEFVS